VTVLRIVLNAELHLYKHTKRFVGSRIARKWIRCCLAVRWPGIH